MSSLYLERNLISLRTCMNRLAFFMNKLSNSMNLERMIRLPEKHRSENMDMRTRMDVKREHSVANM